MSFDPTHIGHVAVGVLVTLFAMSVVSIGIMVERAWTFRRAARQTRAVAGAVSRLLKQGKTDEALAASEQPASAGSPLALVLAAGLQEWRYQRGSDSDRDTAGAAAREALQQAIVDCVTDLRRGLSALATIGSTAPFVGLFGTTFGIINAFTAMAKTGANGMNEISAGIAEALITTAFGLFVAVPAVWAYNALANRVERIEAELGRSGYQLVSHLLKRGE